MRNFIVKFSGGASSFAAAAWLKDNYPNDNIVLYFCDTLWEDDDLYRFNTEVSNKLKLPILTHSAGISPPQLMVKQRFMANNRVGTCSQELKIKVAMEFLKNGKKPPVETWLNREFLKQENFTEDATLIYGIGINELHRADPIKNNWLPYMVYFPHIEHEIDTASYFKKYDIAIPKLYKESFSHNNCGGKCVKGGISHFRNLFLRREESYMELKEQEIIISQYIRYTRQGSYSKDRDYLYNEVWDFVSTGKKTEKLQHIIDTHKYTKNCNFGNRNRPYSFMKTGTLEDLEQKGVQLDIWDEFDFGGCGCSIDYGTCSITA